MTISFRDLSTKFLAWSKLHQAPRSHEYYEGYVQKYIAVLGDKADEPAEAMKPFQIQEWVDNGKKADGKAWSDNYKRGGVVAINRVYNWSMNSGYIENNPIRKANKPQAQPRKTYMKPTDYNAVLGCLKESDPFRDFLIFAWNTGARPQEVRHIEHRHVNLEHGYTLFPKEESKGKRRARRILLNPVALEIIKRNMEKYPDGKILRNSRGQPWTKFAVCARMQELSKRLGKRMVCYEARHGFFTRKLKEGVGLIDLAEIGGHTNGNMIATVYQHVGDDIERLKGML